MFILAVVGFFIGGHEIGIVDRGQEHTFLDSIVNISALALAILVWFLVKPFMKNQGEKLIGKYKK